jgi:hypothetical protein
MKISNLLLCISVVILLGIPAYSLGVENKTDGSVRVDVYVAGTSVSQKWVEKGVKTEIDLSDIIMSMKESDFRVYPNPNFTVAISGGSGCVNTMSIRGKDNKMGAINSMKKQLVKIDQGKCTWYNVG